jgi:hypothetical protein
MPKLVEITDLATVCGGNRAAQFARSAWQAAKPYITRGAKELLPWGESAAGAAVDAGIDRARGTGNQAPQQ